MSLADLKKEKAKRVLGIDASTNSIAWCLYYNRKPVQWGKVTLNGSDVYAKLYDGKKKVAALRDTLKADYIAMEAAIMVRSVDVAIKLAYVYGAILGELMENDTKVMTVAPISWQSHIGNKNFTKAEKAKVEADNPGKSKSWYQNHIREIRKQRTMTYFNKRFNVNVSDNDVGDAMGIANFAYYTLTTRN